MLYAIIGRDGRNSLAIRRKVRSEHLARAKALLDEGRILLAGPFPAVDASDPGPAGFSGSLIVAEFDSIEAAREWVEADPYVTEGVFESYEVQPFLKVLP